jgi:hypothetical protein
MNEYGIPVNEERRPDTANERIIPVAKTLDIIMDRLTDTENILDKIIQAICAANPKVQEKPEMHSLQQQVGIIGEKTDRVLNMANEIYDELFGE